ncbi:MAG: lipoprotein signal peptidase [Gammaproteobacteria bacterium]|nr:lipoprotein signal peptidase [Gammaproteobacteria bacterium]
MLRWVWLSAAVVILDQAAKLAADAALAPYEPVAVLPLLNLTLSYNTGAAFSLLAGAGGWQRWLFTLVAVVVAAAIVVWLRRLPAHERWTAGGLALVLGGALGNVIDRLWHGYVIDFIDVYYGEWHWPAFNIADSAITVGVGVLIVSMLLESRASPAGEDRRGGRG